MQMMTTILFLGVLAAGGESDPATTNLLPLLQLGLYHGDELPSRVESGQTWLALVQAQGQYSLVPVQISVATAHDGIVDAEGEMTGKEVSVDAAGEVIVLVESGQLQPGPVTAAGESFWGSFLYPGQQLALNAGGGIDPLDYFAHGRVEPHVQKSSFTLSILDYGISIVCKDQFGDRVERQIAFADEVFEDGAPRLLFAGDLNRDGQLDLLMDLTTHYNVSHIALFLSRTGPGGAPVWEKAAELRTTGC